MNFFKSNNLFNRAKKVIPGATQTFSKGVNQFVSEVSPKFLSFGKGARVWDVDGNEFIDYIQGLLPNILGYSNEEVNDAFYQQVQKGNSYSLPHPLEVELAEKICDLVPCAEMVRFGKNGSDATAGAVRLARAVTERDHIACCGYHGWHDWFIGTTSRNKGVPKSVKEMTHTFEYNNLDSLEKIFKNFPNEVAAVILEPVNFVEPHASFLENVQKMVRQNGAVLIFDEICSGFHFGLGGAQKRFNITPDLACFGKAMGNGYPISALVGKREIMNYCEEIFYSFTFGGEVGSVAASLKVIEILEKTDALDRIRSHGEILKTGINSLLIDNQLNHVLSCEGFPEWSLLQFNDLPNASSLILRSLLQQELISEGILILVTHNMTASHEMHDIVETLNAYEKAFKKLKTFLENSDPSSFLKGTPIQPVFKVRG